MEAQLVICDILETCFAGQSVSRAVMWYITHAWCPNKNSAFYCVPQRCESLDILNNRNSAFDFLIEEKEFVDITTLLDLDVLTYLVLARLREVLL